MFVIEKDWITEAGLRAVVVVHPAGHRCGYVGLQEGHRHYSKNYDDLDVEVHGGLTYGGNKKNYPAVSEGLSWFGFDCAHLGDARDPSLMKGEYKECYDKGYLHMEFEGDTIKTLDYCIGECESLARQLV